MGDIKPNFNDKTLQNKKCSAPRIYVVPKSALKTESSRLVIPKDAKIISKPRLVVLPEVASTSSSKNGSALEKLVSNRKSAIKIINAPKIHNKASTHVKESSEEEIKFGLDKKSKSIMLHSAKSKAQQLASISTKVSSLMQPLSYDGEEETSLKVIKKQKLLDSIHETQENEFGAIEIVEIKQESPSEIMSENKKEDDEDNFADTEDIDLTCREGPLQESPTSNEDFSTSPPPTKKARKDEILCCEGCGCYGMAGEFYNSSACSQDCVARLAFKSRPTKKKGKDLKIQKLKRDTKRKEVKLPTESFNSEINESPSPPSSSASSEKNVTQENSRAGTPLINDQKGELHLNYPWFDPKKKAFCWTKYLESTSSKGAPTRLFKHNVSNSPPSNWFNVGMKLEAIDPEHPSLICVATVSTVQGYRLRLHFDGFSDSYDIWESGDSPNIFPVGFSGKDRLTSPKSYEKFDWKKYLQANKSVAAPEKFFKNKLSSSKSNSSVDLSDWKIGTKLEAVDKQNTSLICVASVADVVAGRILIHFDGWEKDYDYWVTPQSPYVHPKGWCYENGFEINPPNDFPEDVEFDWDVYLKETNSRPVPSSAFKCRQENTLFKKDMKLEVVDKRNPEIIRVASVAEVNGRQIKAHFDGWPDDYDVWMEDDSPDLYPPGWCEKINNMNVTPPLTPEEVKFYSSKNYCPTPGCKGIGHIKGPKFSSHKFLSDCPYAPHNLKLDSQLPDRFQEDSEQSPKNLSKVQDVNKNEYNKENSAETPLNLDIRHSVFHPRHWPSDANVPHSVWERNSAFLTEKIVGLPDVQSWTSLDVVRFITTLPGLEGDRHLAERIYEEEVDGQSFILLTQADLVQILGLKLGPAIKIFHAIQILKSRSASLQIF